MYAKQLTRNYLEYLGITNITEDGKIFKNDIELSQHFSGEYYNIGLYDPAISRISNVSGQITIGVHRAVYAWYNKIVPDGFVVDHINNIKTDNRLSNLQLLTPRENIMKDRLKSTKELRCRLDIDRSVYEDKLKYYAELYELAKIDKNAKNAHKYRNYIYQFKAKLRYYDNNIHNIVKYTDNKFNFVKDWNTKINRKKDKHSWHNICSFLAKFDKDSKDDVNCLENLYNMIINERD